MPRPATGTLETHEWADGRTVSYYARVRYQGRKHRVLLGTNFEGWSPERARAQLARIVEQIAAGVWEPPSRKTATPEETDPTVHVTLSEWWAKHGPTLDDDTREDYLGFRLRHLLADEICDMQTRTLDARTIDQLIGRLQGRGLGPRSVNMIVMLLAQALDDAVRFELLKANPARGKGTRLKVPEPPRAFLEADMVTDLLQAAGDIEAGLPPHQRFGRRAFLACLVLAGPRIEELIDTDRAALDLHAGILRLGSKTAAGRGRILELSFFLQSELRDHLAAMAAMGRPLAPDDPLFPTYGRGGQRGRLNPSNVRVRLLGYVEADRDGKRWMNKRIKGKVTPVVRGPSAVELANDRRASAGRLLLPKVGPHALRRTFASLAFAAGRGVDWVMGQLGHDDPRMTLSVYRQTMKRARLDRGLIWELMRFHDEEDTWTPNRNPVGAR